MGGENNQVLWRGVRPVEGISGVWPARDATRVYEAQPQTGVGTKSLKTVPANKKLFISGGVLATKLPSNEDCFVSLYVRDDDDAFAYAIMRHYYEIAGQQTTPLFFSPALEAAADYQVILYVQHAKLDAYCAIFGWQEDV